MDLHWTRVTGHFVEEATLDVYGPAFYSSSWICIGQGLLDILLRKQHLDLYGSARSISRWICIGQGLLDILLGKQHLVFMVLRSIYLDRFALDKGYWTFV